MSNCWLHCFFFFFSIHVSFAAADMAHDVPGLLSARAASPTRREPQDSDPVFIVIIRVKPTFTTVNDFSHQTIAVSSHLAVPDQTKHCYIWPSNSVVKRRSKAPATVNNGSNNILHYNNIAIRSSLPQQNVRTRRHAQNNSGATLNIVKHALWEVRPRGLLRIVYCYFNDNVYYSATGSGSPQVPKRRRQRRRRGWRRASL